MGTLMSVKQMLVQWKTIVVCLAGLVGMCAGTMTLGALIFGTEAAIVATPPLSGGIVAYMIMSEGATAMGRPELATLALAVLVLQSFVGYPLTSFLLKREARHLLGDYKSGKTLAQAGSCEEGKTILPQLPSKYVTNNTTLFKVAVAGLIGMVITSWTNEIISRYLILLIVGVILAEIGFLDRSPLIKSQVFGFTSVVIVGFVVVSELRLRPRMWWPP